MIFISTTGDMIATSMSQAAKSDNETDIPALVMHKVMLLEELDGSSDSCKLVSAMQH